MIEQVEYTKTQAKIMEVLKDGLPHRRKELVELLPDKEGEHRHRTLSVHITHLRKKLQPIGESIVCEVAYRTICYRHVRLISFKE